MKKSFLFLSVLFASVILFSCSGDDNDRKSNDINYPFVGKTYYVESWVEETMTANMGTVIIHYYTFTDNSHCVFSKTKNAVKTSTKNMTYTYDGSKISVSDGTKFTSLDNWETLKDKYNSTWYKQ